MADFSYRKLIVIPRNPAGVTWESPGTIPITATHIDGWYQEIATALRPRNDTVFEHIRRGGLKIRPIVIPSEAEESTHLKGQKIPRLHVIPLGMTAWVEGVRKWK